MTVVRRRQPKTWPPGVEIPIRALLLDITHSEFYKNESELSDEISGRLADSLLHPESFVAEYQEPSTGIWKSCGGWESPSFGTPQLSPGEVASLARAATDLPPHGQATWWVACDVKPEDVLEALVLAGWVPSQAGIDLAIQARRLVDHRDAGATA